MHDPTATGSVASGEPPTGALRFFAPGTEIGRRYELREVLGTGGYAVVYRAYDRSLRRDVALKVLRPDRAGSETLKRFRREVTVARDVASPRLVRIYDIEDATETVFLTMELVEGESLRDRLRRGPLPWEEASRIAGEVLEGLAALHGVGVIHRDVKPANILLDASGSAKLADFGLARELERGDSMTATDTVVGTLDYLAPEQALGRDVDARADLYALGCVLFEMLTGNAPHRSRSSVGTLVAHVQETAPRVRTLVPSLPPFLDDLVARLLEKRPAARYPSAEAARADLAARKARPRVRWTWLAAALAAAATVAGVALFPSAARRAIRVTTPGAGALAAYDANGRVLWSRSDLPVGTGWVTYRSPAGLGIAVLPVQGAAGADDIPLSLLHAATGREVARFTLPVWAYPLEFGERWTPTRVTAADLEGDGLDELLVDVPHAYWPSVTVLVNPKRSRADLLFAASGHHSAVAFVDLNGDGIQEVILAGPSNRLGWYFGMAAVDPSGLLTAADASHHGFSSFTPDMDGATPRSGLLWYALAPPEWRGSEGFPRIRVDAARRLLGIGLSETAEALLSFDGFRAEGRSALAPAERQARRSAAYALLRNALQLSVMARFDDALGRVEAARRAAEDAGDSFLVEWTRRTRTVLLAQSGRTSEAESEVRALLAGTPAGPEICFDLARTFHLSGDLHRAIAWYREGQGLSRNVWGRSRAEFFEGLVLAHLERGHLDEALEEVRRLDQGDGAAGHADVLRGLLLWRLGPPTRLAPPRMVANEDPYEILALELRLAAGDQAAKLLEEAGRLEPRLTFDKGLHLSLKAELRRRLGQRKEARQDAARAFDVTLGEAKTDVFARALLPLVAERHAGMAEEEGERAEARRVREAAARALEWAGAARRAAGER